MMKLGFLEVIFKRNIYATHHQYLQALSSTVRVEYSDKIQSIPHSHPPNLISHQVEERNFSLPG
jgi:hypothetical protein